MTLERPDSWRPKLHRAFPLVAILAAAAAASPPAVTISAGPFIAEGVAAGPEGQALVSAVFARTIVSVDRGGVRQWLRPGRLAPVGALFGMAADPARDRLWVAETFGADLPGQSGPARVSLLEVELSSGRAIERHPAADDGRTRSLGDVALAADGGVYASDSRGGIYRLDRRSGVLAIMSEGQLRSPQGLVPTPDGRALIVADYPTGLHRLDLRSGKLEPLGGDGARLRGLDGLVRYGRSLIATQNGSRPNQILRLWMSPDERNIETVETLAQGPARIDDLSLGAVIGRRFVFVAHSQWSEVGGDGRMRADPAPAMLSSIGLGAPTRR